MSPVEPVTEWGQRLQAGDRAAAQKLWEAFYTRLVGLARHKLRGTPRRATDEEDVVLSAFDSFCRGAEQGRYPQFGDRDNLWQLLVTITVRKALDLAQHERRKKRDFRRVQQEPDRGVGDSSAEPALAAVVGREPDPRFATEFADECRRLLDELPDAELRSIALLKMDGFTNDEVAARVGCASATVTRRLGVIRKLWQRKLANNAPDLMGSRRQRGCPLQGDAVPDEVEEMDESPPVGE